MAVVLSTAASLVLALSCVAVAGPIEDGLAASGCNDYATALQLLRPLAEQGSAKAQNIIGTMYLHGLGLPKDEAQAVAWWRKAYRHGDRLSGLELAESGHLAREDVVELKRWSIEAANKGDASG